MRGGLRLETKVRRDGSGLETAPTEHQPEVARRDVRRVFDRYVAERQREAELQAAAERAAAERAAADRAAAKRAAAERARWEAEHAARAEVRDAERQCLEAEAARRTVERERELEQARAAEAERDRARRLSEREAAEFYAARRYERAEWDRMPDRVRRSFREYAGELRDPEYYSYRTGRDLFYVTRYTTSGGRRVEIITDAEGRLVDRIEVSDRPPPVVEVRERDVTWDREHGWDRGRERVSRHWIPAEARRALDETARAAGTRTTSASSARGGRSTPPGTRRRRAGASRRARDGGGSGGRDGYDVRPGCAAVTRRAYRKRPEFRQEFSAGPGAVSQTDRRGVEARGPGSKSNSALRAVAKRSANGWCSKIAPSGAVLRPTAQSTFAAPLIETPKGGATLVTPRLPVGRRRGPRLPGIFTLSADRANQSVVGSPVCPSSHL